MQRKKFACDKCGICCQKLNRSSLYDDLNDGTGVCIYYDQATKLCSIYETRPEKCNIGASYKYFKEQYTYDEYLEVNKKSCHILKRGY